MTEITFWGKLADTVGTSKHTVALPDSVRDTGKLRAFLENELGLDGALRDPANRIAINDQIVVEPATLCASDRIAFLPPVGGG
ncbi:MAG: MoaD/ThiS family protein [Pseudomonadota bacterium]